MPDPASAWISKQSRFGDNLWMLDALTPGQPDAAGTLDWQFQIVEGVLFTDPVFEDLRNTLKRFVWSLMSERTGGLALTAGSIRKVSTGIKVLVTWMFNNDYHKLSELTSVASEEFLCDLQDEYRGLLSDEAATANLESGADEENASTESDDELTTGMLRPRLQIWAHLWTQREVMLRFGSDVLPEKPFSGRSPRSLANELATKAEGWILPVPDEVALPVMREAHRWVIERSQDILALQLAYLDAYASAGHLCEAMRVGKAKSAIEDFWFSADPATACPWREPITPCQRKSIFGGQWRINSLGSHQIFRTLLEDLCAACVIVIQSEAGLRINEICGLSAGASSQSGSIVEVRGSKTGLNEHFFLRGLLSKMQRGPREVEWLIGSRPSGSREVPATAQAVWILEKLFEPLRTRALNPNLQNSLILCFTAPRGYPRDGVHVGRPIGAMLRKLQRQFIGNNVDLSCLPDRNRADQNLVPFRESAGACLKTHSWRKTFAQYVFRTDARMTPAVAQQFHHLSLAMTEEGYLGNDPTLLEVMDSVRQEQTALVFYELARGHRPAAGRLAKLVDDYRAELAQLVGSGNRREGLDAIKRWVIAEDLRIWFSRHGKCFIKLAPVKSRCHQLGGSEHWSNGQPNFAFRTPDACLGCPVYAVDAENESFWARRFTENARWLESGFAIGGARAVAELRVRQSEAVLRAIGAVVPDLGALNAQI
ncbi:hypothetical protein LRK24_11295 [Rhodanobacter denitrificans]|uniref:hypothetical protein n=1 Tax=Rhodanobacter TaxID=75309 RepID=UPI0012DF4086|nr:MULTISPECIES: hypothetical protein [Rhodanobacter]UJM89033.1 hypothetical protein LRK24_11295 [Rhodanobacter denitrificans]